MYNSLDKGKKTIAIYLDLTKAFDTVNHIELIKTLPNFGIKLNSLKWISYLTERQQIVKINKVLGQKRKIVCGVPQGSVLGPLFLYYILIVYAA